MKCVILSGGSGDRLWPLSRKSYPKQFLNFNRKLSLFQETITRNMPFVDEFYIITSEKYHAVVDGQLRHFQGLKYRVFLEEQGCGTAGALAALCQLVDRDERLLVMPADLLITGEGYSQAIYQAKQMMEEDADIDMMLFGIRPENPSTSYGYIRYKQCQVTRFIEKPSEDLATRIFADDDILWNSGMLMTSIHKLSQQLIRYAPELMKTMQQAVKHVTYLKYGEITLHKEDVCHIPRRGIEATVLEKCDHIHVVEMNCKWSDISDLSVFQSKLSDSEGHVIRNNTSNTTIINTSVDQLVVANGVKNQYIVNTPDAIYITDQESASDIKQIIRDNYQEYGEHFDVSSIGYRPWGTKEMLRSEVGYRVRKITIFPGGSLTRHIHEKRNENYTVTRGILSVELEEGTRQVAEGESITIAPGTLHRLFNGTDQEIIVIEVDTGAEIVESDLVHFEEIADDKLPSLYRLKPAFKDYLWGGTRLVEQFHKESPYPVTAESWELSAHPAGQSMIFGGPFDGVAFGDFVEEHGSVVCGWKSNTFDHFPILIKFIDAKQSLSIQIHPDDDYAFIHEGEFGKNEMWYVMDAAQDASLYCGLSREVTRHELESRIADGTITDVLNELKVHQGDVIFVPAGTIHAIGAGILVCEIQQNSNSTYRVYDYKRVDKNGQERELHVDRALDVVNLQPYLPEITGFTQPEKRGDNSYQILSQCKYFQTAKYEIADEETIVVDDSSFLSLVFLSGNAEISCDSEWVQVQAGESVFVSAGRKVVHITGSCEVIATSI